MGIVNSRMAIVKILIVMTAVGFFLISVILDARTHVAASAFGPSASHTNAPGEDNCTACHSDFPVNSGTGSVSISGVPQSYSPGQHVGLTVTTSEETAAAYGFQLTAIDSSGKTVGTFTLPQESPARTQLVNGLVDDQYVRQYVEHTVDGLSNGGFGSNSWTFTWTAPAQLAGTISFYAAGNGANGLGTPAGDYIYTTSVSSASASLITITGKVLTQDLRGVRNAKVTLTGQNISVSTTTSTFGVYSFTGIPTGQTYALRVLSKSYRFMSQSVTPNGDLTNVNFVGSE